MKLRVKKNYDGFGHSIENAILLWIGQRIYPYTNADQMSYLALTAAFGMGCIAYIAGNDLRYLWLMIPGILIHGIGDGLDGKIAKLRNEQRPKYGYYMDRMFDSISFSLVFSGIHFSSITHSDMWIFVLVMIQLVMAHIFLKASVTSIFDMQIGKFGGTEMKLAEIAVVIIVVLSGNPIIGPFQWAVIDWIGLGVTIALACSLVGSVVRSLYGSKIIREE